MGVKSYLQLDIVSTPINFSHARRLRYISVLATRVTACHNSNFVLGNGMGGDATGEV